LEVTHQKTNDIVILKVSGKLDSNTSPEFEAKLFSFINEGEKKILVDCERLDYISSAGLRVLLFAAKKLKPSGGIVALASLKEHIKEVFEISGFNSIFNIYNSSDEAVKTMQQI
jgi:anti-sigma B factor antagonist